MSFVDALPELNKTATKYLEKAQKELKYCITCQPYDGGDYIWIMGTKTTVDEIFEGLNVPEKYREDIATHLYCPNCGNEGFEQYDVVGTKDINDFEIETEIRRQEKVFKKFANKVQCLKEYLSEYPSLGLGDPMGRKIRQEIQKSKQDAITISAKSWSRARIVEGAKVFNESDLMAPGIGLSSGGRFHHPGQSVLYLAEDERLAMAETLNQTNVSSLVWVQEYQQSTDIIDILDLRNSWTNVSNVKSETVQALLASSVVFDKVEDRNSKWRPQYLLPNFIADCAREAGFRGIIYSSTRGDGDNLVLFDPEDLAVQTIGEPKVLKYEPNSTKVRDESRLTDIF